MDLTGKELQSKESEFRSGGRQLEQINTAELTPGQYLLLLTVNGNFKDLSLLNIKKNDTESSEPFIAFGYLTITDFIKILVSGFLETPSTSIFLFPRNHFFFT